jgi:hypothetical protein
VFFGHVFDSWMLFVSGFGGGLLAVGSEHFDLLFGDFELVVAVFIFLLG